MRLLLLSFTLLFSSVVTYAGLQDRFPTLVPPAAPRTLLKGGVRITYLGTNAYLLESDAATILVDPYFSRMSLMRSALALRTVAQPELVAQWLRTAPRIDGILATHGHVDHLFDVPQIARATGARVIASPGAVELITSVGVSRAQTSAATGGEIFRVRGATIHVFQATHDRVLGRQPFPGQPRRLPPRTVRDWAMGDCLAFLIELGGRRIFINSGSLPDAPAPALGRVDLAILGVATPDAVRAFAPSLAALRPRFVLPSHQDDFFRPLAHGFSFLPGTNFPRVQRAAAAQGRRLILLDYFTPWKLP